jgi:hypothetical protein
MALSRGSHVRVPKPIFSSQVAPMDQRAGLCVFTPTLLRSGQRELGGSERRIVTAPRAQRGSRLAGAEGERVSWSTRRWEGLRQHERAVAVGDLHA